MCGFEEGGGHVGVHAPPAPPTQSIRSRMAAPNEYPVGVTLAGLTVCACAARGVCVWVRGRIVQTRTLGRSMCKWRREIGGCILATPPAGSAGVPSWWVQGNPLGRESREGAPAQNKPRRGNGQCGVSGASPDPPRSIARRPSHPVATTRVSSSILFSEIDVSLSACEQIEMGGAVYGLNATCRRFFKRQGLEAGGQWGGLRGLRGE